MVKRERPEKASTSIEPIRKPGAAELQTHPTDPESPTALGAS